MPQFAGSGWPSARAISAKLFGFAQDANCLVGDVFAEGGEADEAARALDQGHPEQRLEFAQSGGEGRLRDEARIGRLAEMSMASKRDQILKLLQVGRWAAINRLTRSMSA